MTALDARVAAAVAAWPDHRTPAEQAAVDAAKFAHCLGAVQWVRTGVKPATTHAATCPGSRGEKVLHNACSVATNGNTTTVVSR